MGINKAIPAPSRDVTHNLDDDVRNATKAVVKGLHNGSRIDFILNNNPRDEKLINIGSIVDTVIGDYFGDKWDFIIIGNDEGI